MDTAIGFANAHQAGDESDTHAVLVRKSTDVQTIEVVVGEGGSMNGVEARLLRFRDKMERQTETKLYGVRHMINEINAVVVTSDPPTAHDRVCISVKPDRFELAEAVIPDDDVEKQAWAYGTFLAVARGLDDDMDAAGLSDSRTLLRTASPSDVTVFHVGDISVSDRSRDVQAKRWSIDELVRSRTFKMYVRRADVEFPIRVWTQAPTQTSFDGMVRLVHGAEHVDISPHDASFAHVSSAAFLTGMPPALVPARIDMRVHFDAATGGATRRGRVESLWVAEKDGRCCATIVANKADGTDETLLNVPLDAIRPAGAHGDPSITGCPRLEAPPRVVAVFEQLDTFVELREALTPRPKPPVGGWAERLPAEEHLPLGHRVLNVGDLEDMLRSTPRLLVIDNATLAPGALLTAVCGPLGRRLMALALGENVCRDGNVDEVCALYRGQHGPGLLAVLVLPVCLANAVTAYTPDHQHVKVVLSCTDITSDRRVLAPGRDKERGKLHGVFESVDGLSNLLGLTGGDNGNGDGDGDAAMPDVLDAPDAPL
jgi:hypothetical protein